VAAFALSEQGIGVEEGQFMSRKTARYTEGDIGKLKLVKDFLPPPDQLVLREENVKITISLSRRSLEFFKREATKRRVPYQRMIRALVGAYAEREEQR
jgi:predicted DNA binding CopG/RHH family protein